MSDIRPASPDESLAAKASPARLDFFCQDAPEEGTLTELADGLFWLRMPLPMTGLDHINLYVLRDGDGWTIVDTGIGSKANKDVWKKVLSDELGGKPVKRVICTHLHPDHTGLAGWLCKKFEAPLLMTRAEYFLCRLLAADTGKPAPQFAIDFYHRAGLDENQLEFYKARFGGFGKAITPLPVGYTRIKHGDILTIDGKPWEIVEGSGHSPEHACLYNRERNIALTGDQLLPNISSNVSVWPTEPEGNPLQEWIDSCYRLCEVFDEDTLVAPAHGIPFRGAVRRLQKLIEHHEKALRRLHAFCDTPKQATDCYSVLFRRRINDGNRIMAVGESVAHLNCLLERGLVTRLIADGGQYLYVSTGDYVPS